ncbi:MAG: cobalamin-binding protein [Chloroflexi bacterium]|nr:cobalamin-binding protein [Chloroflexota bacterium]
MAGYGPRRIVCLTAETTEIAFRLGCHERVVGVSGYAVRPPEARKKPHVAAFQTAHVGRILALEPDLVLGFSDLQADIVRELVRRGAQVLVTNQRTLDETYTAIAMIAGALGEAEAGERLIVDLRSELESVFAANSGLTRSPRVYFEEWDEPFISGIAWVGEIIERCGGEDIFAGRRGAAATDRVIAPEDVIAADPELIVASWCGKKANLARIASRPGWAEIAAVRAGRIHEIKAPDILQPGPSLGLAPTPRCRRSSAAAARSALVPSLGNVCGWPAQLHTYMCMCKVISCQDLSLPEPETGRPWSGSPAAPLPRP